MAQPWPSDHSPRQKNTVTQAHAHDVNKIGEAYRRLRALFSKLKAATLPLKPKETWRWLMGDIIDPSRDATASGSQ